MEFNSWFIFRTRKRWRWSMSYTVRGSHLRFHECQISYAKDDGSKILSAPENSPYTMPILALHLSNARLYPTVTSEEIHTATGPSLRSAKELLRLQSSVHLARGI
eukprot:TRINITY_DN22070_c0_g1_i2.p1 TRINITY_DN22070_c0_g1~~TRINITY_DN22070_c0_g1_i2.p1  ORF type:complete len:105 (-),score=7.39 TRINITY_DN22070_c0_g1_i2:245-559(-)